jgi:hypothetical protein
MEVVVFLRCYIVYAFLSFKVHCSEHLTSVHLGSSADADSRKRLKVSQQPKCFFNL